MLRITDNTTENLITLKVEGKLKGAWVKELERVWHGIRSRPEPKPIRVDLSAVSFVDERGKGALAAMLRAGVELRAAGPLMESVVEEVAERAAAVRPTAEGQV